MKTLQKIEITCAERIPGGAATILDPVGLSKKEVKTKVWSTGRVDVAITLDENDVRVPQILALLALYKEEPWLQALRRVHGRRTSSGSVARGLPVGRCCASLGASNTARPTTCRMRARSAEQGRDKPRP
jgi:hypothetical protein